VLVLGLAGGWFVTTRSIRPLRDISGTAMKISAGDLSQRIPAAKQASELGELTEVLNSTFARLEAVFAQQARFTSDAAHELRTPVSVILTQTQTALSRERSGADYRSTLEACQRAAQRMRELIESLLELARLDSGSEPMEMREFDLGRVVRECLELIAPLAAESGLTLKTDLPEVKAVGDPDRMAQVVTNLLANAVHYNREGGEVAVRAGADQGEAWLEVENTGPGIPAADLPHVFERFYRVDKARTKPGGRTGLGLAIAKAIVDSHGGRFSVESVTGERTRFSVRLPLAVKGGRAVVEHPQIP
jgi:heavy metal sensor kinase